MKFIIGLGNPGDKYSQTRHNVGFEVVDLLAQQEKVSLKKAPFEALMATTRLSDGEKLLLLKPLTYVNRTGSIMRSLQTMIADEDLMENMMVVCDDVHLPLGQLRLRKKGSSGGHNGLQSIVDALGSNGFARLRIGVDEPGRKDYADYVLSRFNRSERKIMEEATSHAVDALHVWTDKGIDTAMNQFNKSAKKGEGKKS